jgi:hypothetical protein
VTPRARYVWHHDLHGQSGETLHFVRLYFEPVFPDVVEPLESRLSKLGVTSAHVYELIGANDLLIRVWLPPKLDVRKFIEELALPDLRRADYMRVGRTREHWVLEDSSTEVPKLADISPHLIDEVNEAIYRETPLHRKTLEESVSRGWLGVVHEPEEEPEAKAGVKFFISVGASVGSSPSIDFEEVLFRRVRKVLDDAKDLIDRRSIYAGDGFARLLLMGRFSPDRYFEFINRILLQLNDEDMREVFIARTYTALGSRPHPLIALERLNAPTVARVRSITSRERPNLVELLERGEGQFLEVKGSAFLNIDRLVTQDELNWANLRPEFVKAVCGLLNQLEPLAATLIVGAVETRKYRRWLAEHGRNETVGGFTILGLEEDNPSGDWDKYQRRLMDSLASAIDPSPAPFITATLEEFSRRTASSTLLRLDLTPTGIPFYTRDEGALWVRSGAQVNKLTTRDRDEFVGRMRAGAHGE